MQLLLMVTFRTKTDTILFLLSHKLKLFHFKNRKNSLFLTCSYYVVMTSLKVFHAVK